MTKKIAFLLLTCCIFINAYAMYSHDTASLRITVRDNLGNLVEGAKVQLYLSEEDYRHNQNPATEALMTDEKGRVKFKKLDPIIYYVDVQKGDMNNVDAGVKTNKLEPRRTNLITIIIE